MTDRVVACVDGFNLYYGLKADHGRRNLWRETCSCRLSACSRPVKSSRRSGTSRPGCLTIPCAVKVRWLGYDEKEADVNIALALVEDAVRDYYDNAFLISGDSHLEPAVVTVKRLRPGEASYGLSPPRRDSVALIAAADAYIRIGADKIRHSQLPAKVVTAGGVLLERPAHWN